MSVESTHKEVVSPAGDDDDSNQDSEMVTTDSERGQWNNYYEYILACIGYSVGLGNVWRFPTVCYENGGGAFLIPYITLLLLIGKPMYLMELAMGQYTRQGPPGCFKFVPIAVGAGYAILIIALNVSVYYNVLMAYTLYYAFASFNKNFALDSLRKVLKSHESTGIGDIGPVKWDLFLLLIVSWAMVCLILIKGIKSAGKVVYVTATMPYVILAILLGRGAMLKGAYNGIIYFIKPDFKKIFNPTVWQKAAGQMFFSLSLTFGGLMTYASFAPFHNNLPKDAMIVTYLDTATSLIAGFVIFSVLGFMADVKHTSIANVVSSGPGLAFVTYPEALSKLPWPNFWSLLFFIMLYTLGIDSQIAFIETIQTALHDQFPRQFPRKRKLALLSALCFLGFILGLPCVTRGGTYVMDLMDHYASNTCCIIVAIVETVAIMYIYGYQNFAADLSFMLGHELPWKGYWYIGWRFAAPVGLTVIVCGYFVQSIFLTDDLKREITFSPVWAQFIGYGLFCLIVFQIPIWAWIKVRQAKGETLREKLQYAIHPTASFERIRSKQENLNEKWGGFDNPNLSLGE